MRREAASWEDLSSARYRFSRGLLHGRQTHAGKQTGGGPADRHAGRSQSRRSSVSQRRCVALWLDRESHAPPALQRVASGRGDGKRQCAAGEEFGASSGLRRSHGWTFGGGSPASQGHAAGQYCQRQHPRRVEV